MELNLGYLGATRQTWRDKDVRELVIKLMESNPRASREKLIRLFCDRMREDEEYMEAAADYAVTNALNSIESLQNREKHRVPEVRAKGEAETRVAVESVKSQIMMLNLEQPNGKRLRYCTREEIAKWGKGYDKMVKGMKPRQLVGQAFSEADVRKFLVA